jgi:hypothetical protein
MAKIDPSSLHHRMSIDEGWVLDVLLVVILTTLPDIAHRLPLHPVGGLLAVGLLLNDDMVMAVVSRGTMPSFSPCGIHTTSPE